jgi:surface polysaccharide O-acyltransferase-like enzyme
MTLETKVLFLEQTEAQPAAAPPPVASSTSEQKPEMAPAAIPPPAPGRLAKPPKENDTERLIFVPAIRAYAMSIVVVIHVASILAPHFNTIAPYDWWISNAYHAFSKGGPPLFTLVSGMLLLSVPKEQPIPLFFSKRFIKVLIPFVGWAAIYLAWRIFYKGEQMDAMGIAQAFFDGPVYYHLWFIQMILGLYLATPILRYYVQAAPRSNLGYFLAVWFVGIGLLPFFPRFLGINIKIDLVVMTTYAGYFVLGYFLKDVVLTPKQSVFCILLVAGFMLLVETFSYLLLINNDGFFDPFFYNNLGFTMVVIAGGLFLFLKSLPYEQFYRSAPPLKWLVVTLAANSLGVYFVHVLIMELLADGKLGFTLNPFTINTAIGIPLAALVTLALSVLVTAMLKKIPVVKNIVP